MSSRRSRSGGQVDRDDVEPVVQVGAEPAGGDLGGEVLVRRRDHPRLERDRPGRADRQDLLVLDRAEQLRLGRPAAARRSRRGRPCPGPAATNSPAWSRSAPVNAPRTWPKSWFSSRSCGIAAPLIARNSRVGLGPARVQGPGDQLLAGARLAGDQHVAPRRADLADQGLDRLHRRALADQRLEVGLRRGAAAAAPGSPAGAGGSRSGGRAWPAARRRSPASSGSRAPRGGRRRRRSRRWRRR